jgi:hypothetical protein
MEEAAAVRRAAREAVDDVEPGPLAEYIDSTLAEGSMVPGALTLLNVSAVGDGPGLAGGDGTLTDGIATRAAGVQLIYEGLRLTRELVHEEPWTVTHPSADRDEADLAILAADVLVARGFYLLARTEAAEAAVAVVQAFGRDQTVRREAGDDGLDRNLEADVLELAVVAGSTAADRGATPQLREYAASLANGHPFEDANTFFPDTVIERLGTLAGGAGASEGVTTSADQ